MDEGPRLTSQIVDCDPEIVKPGMKVKSVFRKLGEDSESGILHYGTKFILSDDIDIEESVEDLPDIEVWTFETYISAANKVYSYKWQKKPKN